MAGGGAGAAAATTAPVAGQASGGMSDAGKLFMASQALSGLTQIAGGLFGARAASQESALIDEQASLAEQEAAYEAEQRARDVRKFQAKQESKYLASGVTLAGSPALVLEETRQLGQQEIDAIMRRGQAQAKLLRMKSKQTRSAGRAGILSSLLGAGAGGFQAYMYGKQFGLFGTPATGQSGPRIDIPETMTPFPGYS